MAYVYIHSPPWTTNPNEKFGKPKFGRLPAVGQGYCTGAEASFFRNEKMFTYKITIRNLHLERRLNDPK